MGLQSLKGVEIFSIGTWNGDTYSQADLDCMVKAFSETSQTMRPPLKLGHTDKQKLIQNDGLPAAGWIGALYTQGGKLIADFIDIPNKIYDLLVKGAYKKVSSEVYWNADLNGSKYSRMLGAVALLGSDMPAVTNLADIMAMYSIKAQEIKSYAFTSDGLIVRSYTNTFHGGDMKTELELKLELDLENEKKKSVELSEQVKLHQQEVADKEKENEELKKFKADAEAKAIEASQALAEAQLDKELSDLEKEKLISPSMKPYVKALMAEEKKEYSFKVGDKEEKFSKQSLLKEILKLHSAISTVNFEENSEDNKVVGDKEKADHLNIEKYAKEHKISYSAAYKAVKKSA